MFSELVKNVEKIREYMRDFYVYGFKVRGEFTEKSARTYDDERRRIESWLSEYVRWDYSEKGKRVFLSVDSAGIAGNPLYAAWKSKSFTRTDIMLHFYLLELLSEPSEKGYGAEELADLICRRYDQMIDPQTIRNKLKEYERMGITAAEKSGRKLCYRLAEEASDEELPEAVVDAVKLMAEGAPFGFVGGTILDRAGVRNDLFRFKHHFLVHTLEDGVLLELLEAMKERREVEVENRSRRVQRTAALKVVPLKIMVSTRTGRRYLCCYRRELRRYFSLRLDYLMKVYRGAEAEDYNTLAAQFEQNLTSCFGVSFGSGKTTKKLSMTIRVDEQRESYLLNRLERERRDGTVMKISEGLYRYDAELYDVEEAVPWIRTFLGRLVELKCEDERLEQKFKEDLMRMARMYAEGENE